MSRRESRLRAFVAKVRGFLRGRKRDGGQGNRSFFGSPNQSLTGNARVRFLGKHGWFCR